METMQFILYTLTIGLWIWAIHDIIKTHFKKRIMTPIWLIVVILLPLLGSIVYFQLKRNQIDRSEGKFSPDFSRHI